jgi:hypothetical protein
VRGILICLLAFAAGMGLWAYNYVYGHRPAHLPAPPQSVSRPIALLKPAPAPAPAPPVIATVPGPRFVHRGGQICVTDQSLPAMSSRKRQKVRR